MTSVRSSTDFLPLPRVYTRAQNDLAWFFTRAIGEMEPPSNMGFVIDALEAGQCAYGDNIDTLVDPWREDRDPAPIRAAARYREVKAALARVGDENEAILRAVYGRTTHETMLLAFGGAANLVPVSRAARTAFGRDSVGLGLLAWAARLAVRCAGEQYPNPDIGGRYLRRPPKASREETAHALTIRRDTESMLTTALRAYSEGKTRNEIGGLDVR